MDDSNMEEEVQKINTLLVVFCSMIEAYYASDYDATKELWDYIFYTDSLWDKPGESTTDQHQRKQMWRDLMGQEPFVNSRENIERMCSLLNQQLNLWLAYQQRLIEKNNPLLQDIEMADIDEIEFSEEIRALQEELGFGRDLMNVLPEGARQLVLDHLASKYGPFILLNLRRVSKTMAASVAQNSYFAHVKACIMMANISSKISPALKSGATLFCAQLLKMQSIHELGNLNLILVRGGVMMSKALMYIINKMPQFVLDAVQMEESVLKSDIKLKRSLGSGFSYLNLVPATMNDLRDSVASKNVGQVKFDMVFDFKRSILIRLYQAATGLTKVFEKLNLNRGRFSRVAVSDQNRVATGDYHLGLPDDRIDYEYIPLQGKMPQFIYLLKKQFEDDISFYLNMDMLGPTGLYSSESNVPVIDRPWGDMATIRTYHQEDRILPPSILRTVAVMGATRHLGNVVQALYRITGVSYEGALSYSSSYRSRWTDSYQQNLWQFDGENRVIISMLEANLVSSKPYSYRVYPLGDMEPYTTVLGVYGSLLAPMLFNSGMEKVAKTREMLEILEFVQFDRSMVMGEVNTLVNVIVAISQVMPVYWSGEGREQSNPLVFYKGLIGFDEIESGEPAANKNDYPRPDLSQVKDMLDYYKSKWISVYDDHEPLARIKARAEMKNLSEFETDVISELLSEKFNYFLDTRDNTVIRMFQAIVLLQVSYPRSVYRYRGRTVGSDGNWAALPVPITWSSPTGGLLVTALPSEIFGSSFEITRQRQKLGDIFIKTYTVLSMDRVNRWLKREVAKRIGTDEDSINVRQDSLPDSVIESFPFVRMMNVPMILPDRNMDDFANARMSRPGFLTVIEESFHVNYMVGMANDSRPFLPRSDYDLDYWNNRIRDGFVPKEIMGIRGSVTLRDTIKIIDDRHRYRFMYVATSEDDILRLQTGALVEEFKRIQDEQISASRARANVVLSSMIQSVQMEVEGRGRAAKRPRGIEL